ncbi:MULTISPECIES: hypothetical protein [Thermoactinomyces]|jgi:hypothetical protein|uniref:Hydrolase n=1 Tax=Thermoactinomyces daqus TaxID=1329516 RepID=A0A7W1XD18_9BACL|nr:MULTISPECIES: hypothetical protein [Thermoactinomyces]MBA4544429.1 hypothetical protein [Thermoactinomyces daqus]MBH8609188.1 hypothetical protein [Thermoactinomyces sp. CICC 10521]
MDDKKTYYVTVEIGQRSGEIRDHLEVNDANYDFEIKATEEEIERLERLFREAEEEDFTTFVKAHIPFLDNESQENVKEDGTLRKIYRMIYQLGTEETKRRMDESGMIH